MIAIAVILAMLAMIAVGMYALLAAISPEEKAREDEEQMEYLKKARMDGLRFPKPEKRKKKKRHGSSIIHQHDGTCFLCLERNGDASIKKALHKHHIFGGSNRSLSEEDGLFVWLCIEHHTQGEHSAHRSAAVADFLHRTGQQAYEKRHSHEEFVARYMKNYL